MKCECQGCDAQVSEAGLCIMCRGVAHGHEHHHPALFNHAPAYVTLTNAAIAIVGFSLGVLFGVFLLLIGVRNL